jgi:Helicase
MHWLRVQFPVAFAMTISRSQEQSLQRVGVYSCFTHGMLYVAASRVSDPGNIKFYIPEIYFIPHITTNLTYRAVLQGQGEEEVQEEVRGEAQG